MKKRRPDNTAHDIAPAKTTSAAPLVPLNENGGAAADFTQREIEEFKTALHNSEYMIRRRLSQARDRLLGRDERTL